jgi:hypothetical protein
MVPIDDDTHREIVEIKSELKEVRQTQDSEVHLQRQKWEDHLERVIDGNKRIVKVLLLVDGSKSAKQLITESGIPQPTCWRMLTKLEREGVVMKLDKMEKGSPIYKVARWYRILRLDDYLRKKYLQMNGEQKSLISSVTENPVEDSNGNNTSGTNENQSA